MPTSLLAAASIFIHSGINVQIVDENIEEAQIDTCLIGLNLLGAPYLPEAKKIQERIEQNMSYEYKFLLGGQIINGLKESEFRHLFSKNTINGNSYPELSRVFNKSEKDFKRIETLSLIPSYELLNDEHMKIYLSTEFSFYLSQGCKHSCSFCSAHRSVMNKEIGLVKRVKEVYRDISIAIKDFEYLLKKAVEFEIQQLRVYLSNLDLFQSPFPLLHFATELSLLLKKYPSVDIKLRGLSTCRSFLNAYRKTPEVIEKMVQVGLYQIGFGIDGATPKVYKETRKPQTVKECLEAIEISKKEYNINPETLMVFGHNNKEDEESLILALKFCEEMQDKYGALPRPHIAKDIVPGNDGWFDKSNFRIVEKFLKNPILFQNLDFTAIPSPITHPDRSFRELVKKYFIKVCELPNSLTQYVLPELPEMNAEQLQIVINHNLERYDI